MTTHADLIANLRSRHRLMYHASPIPSVMTEAADALEALEQQVAALTYDVLHATEERDQKDKEVAALRVDAERYRYLRSQMIDDHFNATEWERGIDAAIMGLA